MRTPLRASGYQPLGNAQGKALHHGGLAHARITHENGVVLATPRQHIHHLADFPTPGENRINASSPGVRREVRGVLVQKPTAFTRRWATGDAVAFTQAVQETPQIVGRYLPELPVKGHGAVTCGVEQKRQHQFPDADVLPTKFKARQQICLLEKTDEQRRENRTGTGTAPGPRRPEQFTHGLGAALELREDVEHLLGRQELFHEILDTYFMAASAHAGAGGLFEGAAAGLVQSRYKGRQIYRYHELIHIHAVGFENDDAVPALPGPGGPAKTAGTGLADGELRDFGGLEP